jgi:hypothetical protein
MCAESSFLRGAPWASADQARNCTQSARCDHCSAERVLFLEEAIGDRRVGSIWEACGRCSHDSAFPPDMMRINSMPRRIER